MPTGIVHFFESDRFISAAGGTDGGTVYFYYTGTTNLAPIYSDSSLTTPLANPVNVAVGQILPNIYLDPSIVYRRRIVHSYDGSVSDVDPLSLFGKLTSQEVSSAIGVSFSSAGSVLAFGGNSGPGTFARGLMIGGGDPKEGGYGILDKLDGHATWRGFWPLRNYASLELALNPTMATLEGSATIGGNTITRLQGSVTDTFWIGKKCYFGEGVFKVSNVVGNVITVTAPDGSPIAWPSSFTEVFRFCIVHGTGTCDIVGDSVTHKSGDPFPIYYTYPSFNFKTGGAARTVTAMPDPFHATLSAAPGDGTDIPFEFWLDVNDQFATFRVHGTSVDAENISLFTRYDGHWLASQYGWFGKYRRISVSTGEVAPGVTRQQIVAYPDGRVTLGGPIGRRALDIEPTTTGSVNYVAVSAGPTGFGPSVRARSSVDANVNLSYDTQGTGRHIFSTGMFGQVGFAVGAAAGADYLQADPGTGRVHLSVLGSSTNADIDVSPNGTGWFNVVTGQGYAFAGVKVIGPRETGFAVMTGAANKASTYDTSTVTLSQLAGRVMSLQAALTQHGLIG